jgi:2-isopropylmalate synthase
LVGVAETGAFMSDDKVIIFDTTLRDGEQTAGVSFTRDDKLEIARALAAMNVDVIEVGFPGASPGEHEAVSAVARAVRTSTLCALARAVPADIDAAVSALRQAAAPRIHVFLNASDMQLAHQLRKSREHVLDMARAMVARARNHTDDVEFSAMDATRADPQFLAELVRAALAAGARTINIPDTVGYILPHALGELVRGLFARVPELAEGRLSFHGQDDLGLATANSIAAVSAGARQIEVAVNGIGERAGNTALEEVVVALRLHGASLGVHTDVDPRGIYAASQLVAARSGIAVAANKALVGRNAFRHASGIHQDGVLKKRETFEWIDPALVGNPHGTEIVLGKLSGRAGFAARARSLGIELGAERLDAAFARFQVIADGKRAPDDDDVRAVCTQLSERV